MTLRFLLIKDFPNSGENKQSAKEFLQRSNIDPPAEQGKGRSRDAATKDRGQNLPDGEITLLPPKTGANNGCGQKEQQIDPP